MDFLCIIAYQVVVIISYTERKEKEKEGKKKERKKGIQGEFHSNKGHTILLIHDQNHYA